MTKTALNLLALKLLNRSAARRKSLCDDVVAETLEEFVDAINETLKELPEDDDKDLIVSHIRAHSQDNGARAIPAPARPPGSPIVLGS